MIINAFIFARGGSKGLPGKNIKDFNGKPLIAYSIELALSLDSVSEVYVSTDDADIARVAEEFGAKVIQRPSHLAQDKSAEWGAWQHAIEYLREQDIEFDLFVSLPATSPLRNKSDIERAISKLNSSGADVCIGVSQTNRSPYFNMVKINSQGYVELAAQGSKTVTRRQDAPTIFDITTVVYATTPNFILNKKSIFDGKVVSIEVPKNRAIDIDDICDFKFAEVLLKESLI